MIGRWIVAWLVGISLLAPTPTVLATTPVAPVNILPIEKSADGAVRGVQVSILEKGLREIDVETRIISAAKTLSIKTAGLSLIGPGALPSGASVPAGSVVADEGGVVELPRTHMLSLSPGAYAEYVHITVIRASGGPFDLAGFRYFEVSASGIAPLTVEEYSRRTQVVQTAPDGTQFLVGGIAPPPRVNDTTIGNDVAVPAPKGAQP